MTETDIDGRFAQGWGGAAPNGVHVNVLLARRGSATASTIASAFTTPSEGFTPVLASLGEDQQSYVTVNPPTIIVPKIRAAEGMPETLVFGAAQLGISQGVLDVVAEGLLSCDQDTLVLVSLWVDPAGDDERAVRLSAREATSCGVREAVLGRSIDDNAALVAQRDQITHPFYGGG